MESVLCAEARDKGFIDPDADQRRSDGQGRLARGVAGEPGNPGRQPRAGAPRSIPGFSSGPARQARPPGGLGRSAASGRARSASRRPARARASIMPGRRRSGSKRRSGEELGAPVSPEAEVVIKARIDDDLCTISIDTSGEPLHKRGHKQAVAKAPMRETMASLFLRQCGFDGDEPVVDPMCGSGTFVIEAAEIAAGAASRAGRGASPSSNSPPSTRPPGQRMRDGRAAARHRPLRPLLRQRPRRRRDRHEPGQCRARRRRRAHGVPPAAVSDIRAERAAGPRHRQPALRRPDRGQEAPLLSLWCAGSDAYELLRRLEGWAGDE